MSAIKAMDDLWWVGVEDHDLRVFDIVMHSDWGTSYNAYAVRGAEGVALFETVTRAVGEMSLEATVSKEENLERIISFGVMALPALVVDGRVVSAGRRLSLDEVKALLAR